MRPAAAGPNSSPPDLRRLGRLARSAFSASSWIGPAAGVASLAIWHGMLPSSSAGTAHARGRVAVARASLVFHWSVRESGVRVLARSAAETNVGTGLKSEPDMSVRCLSLTPFNAATLCLTACPSIIIPSDITRRRPKAPFGTIPSSLDARKHPAFTIINYGRNHSKGDVLTSTL